MTWVLIEALKFFIATMFGAVVCAYFEESRIETIEHKWRARLLAERRSIDDLPYLYTKGGEIYVHDNSPLYEWLGCARDTEGNEDGTGNT